MSRHVHAWRLTSPHPFGAVRRYGCSSCSATREERRESTAESKIRMERALGFVTERPESKP